MCGKRCGPRRLATYSIMGHVAMFLSPHPEVVTVAEDGFGRRGMLRHGKATREAALSTRRAPLARPSIPVLLWANLGHRIRQSGKMRERRRTTKTLKRKA